MGHVLSGFREPLRCRGLMWHLMLWLVLWVGAWFFCRPAQAAFFDASGSTGLLGVSHYDPHGGATEGPLQGVEQLLKLKLELKPGDLTSLYIDLRFWPQGSRYYFGDSYEEELSVAEGTFYYALRPRVSQLYIESATRYCLVSLGRRAKHLGLGIFLNSGDNPWDVHQSLFEGISCNVGSGVWRSLSVELGADKLREGFLLEKGDDAQQFHASITYDDRHMLSGSQLRKQVSLYFAYRNSSSPHLLGRSSDKYIDLFGGLYWKYLAFEAEGLVRMGSASGNAWDQIGARPERTNTVDALAAHTQLSFTYPSPYPWESRNRSPQQEYWQHQLAGDEEEEPEIPSFEEDEGAEEDYADELLDEGEEVKEPSAVDKASATNKPSATNNSATEEGDSAQDAHSSEQRPAPRVKTPTAAVASNAAYYHKVAATYTYSPGDRHGYYKGSDQYLSESRRSTEATALPLHPNFKPALILFNMRTPDLDIDGVYSGTQVMNAHVFTGGYSLLHRTYGNFHFKLIGALMEKGIPSTVQTYFRYNIDESFPKGYYQFARDQYYPVGYRGSYLGTEIDVAYDIKLSKELLWGAAAGYLVVGEALDVGSQKANVIALETYVLWDF